VSRVKWVSRSGEFHRILILLDVGLRGCEALRFFSFESRWARQPGLRARPSATRSTPDPERGNFVGSQTDSSWSGLNRSPGRLSPDRRGLLLARHRLRSFHGVDGRWRSEARVLRTPLHCVCRDWKRAWVHLSVSAGNPASGPASQQTARSQWHDITAPAVA
jgi:hypothetical protein